MFSPAATLAATTSAVTLAGLKSICPESVPPLAGRCCAQPHPLAPNRAFDLGVLQQDEAVRHAGDVVSHHAGKPLVLHLFEVTDRQFLRIVDPMLEERGNDLLRLFMLGLKRLAGV